MEDDWELLVEEKSTIKSIQLKELDVETYYIEDIYDEEIANNILQSSLTTNKYIKYLPSLGKGIITNTPKSIYCSILFQIIKYNISNDWRISIIISFITLMIFLSKYRFIYKILTFILHRR